MITQRRTFPPPCCGACGSGKRPATFPAQAAHGESATADERPSTHMRKSTRCNSLRRPGAADDCCGSGKVKRISSSAGSNASRQSRRRACALSSAPAADLHVAYAARKEIYDKLELLSGDVVLDTKLAKSLDDDEFERVPGDAGFVGRADL
jgi:hypothetical protein